MTQTIGIYLYDEVEVLDFAGPLEVFNTATRMHRKLYGGRKNRFKVVTVAEKPGAITARGGLVVMPDADFTNQPPLDVLIVPGGVHTAELDKSAVIDWVKRTDQAVVITASVCTGAFILGKAGILNGFHVTTHWEDIADLRAMLPRTHVEENARWVDEGRIVTSAGISAGIDMALHLIAKLEDQDLAIRTARQMEYDWQKR